MKKLLLIPALFIVMSARAQTKQYIKIETTHYTKDRQVKSKLIKFEGGTIDISDKIISIDKEAPKPQFFDIARVGKPEREDEGYTSTEYICLTVTKSGGLKAVKIIALYTPKNELCDLIVKTNTTNVDYCLTK